MSAEEEAEQARTVLIGAIKAKQSFRFEAGAGAGKTYSLIESLAYIVDHRLSLGIRDDQRVACLTYTNVAVNEITRRIDANPMVKADTLHGFLWELIQPFQSALAEGIRESVSWAARLERKEQELPPRFGVEYQLGIPYLDGDLVSLSHDDVPALASRLFENKKFRRIVQDRFPFILIDEYQDTPAGVIEAMLGNERAGPEALVLGLFGDSWQQIYDRTCGHISDKRLTVVEKGANFRSSQAPLRFLNELRPDLVQAPRAGAPEGTLRIYHCDNWPGERLGKSFKGQIDHEANADVAAWVRETGSIYVRETEDSNVVLMLTHTAIAAEAGYPELAKVFKNNDQFAKKENVVVAFLVDVISSAVKHFEEHKYGLMFDVLANASSRTESTKGAWIEMLRSLKGMQEGGTILDVLEAIDGSSMLRLPPPVSALLRLVRVDPDPQTEEPRSVQEMRRLVEVDYRELERLAEFLQEDGGLATKHGVKGAEYDDVIVMLGRGWTQYDFPKMLSNIPKEETLDENELARFRRNRNLFYVACSRAKMNFTLVFTQELGAPAIQQLVRMAGAENVVAIDFNTNGKVVR